MSDDNIIDGREPVQTTSEIAEIRAAASVLLERMQFLRQAGITFKGARDLYDILGYDRTISTRQYRDRYARGGIAKRIVEALPKATWRGGWELIEDEDPKVDTPFESAWNDLETQLKVSATLQRVDILSGLSMYAILLIGAPGLLNEELKPGKPGGVAYLTPFMGGGGPNYSLRNQTTVYDADATILQFDTNVESPRFGLPEFYQIKRTDLTSPEMMTPVHWSRIIHIAEGCLDDEVYGQPVLEACWNLLDDLDKVTGGGAEAFWLRANQGLQIDVDKDMALSPEATAALKTEVEEYKHNITRMMKTRGVSVKPLGSDVANFSSPADAILTQIAGTKGIPKRILTGSEMGELASSQDRDNWKDQVNGRQTGYATPNIIRPLVDRLVKYGYLPTPAKGPMAYEVKWAHIQTLTEQEKAAGAKDWAGVNSTAGLTVFTADEIRDKWYEMEPVVEEDTEIYKTEGALKMATTNKTQGAVVFTDDEIRETWFGWKPLTPDQKIPITAPERVSATAPTPPEDAVAGQPNPPQKTPPGAPGAPKAPLPFAKKGAVPPTSPQKATKGGPPAVAPKAAGAWADLVQSYQERISPEWQLHKEGLTREFRFPDRRGCASFLSALYQDANSANHHPDVTTLPDACLVTFVTHQAGDTVTELDFQAAERADRIGLTFKALQHKFASTQLNVPSPLAEEILQLGQLIPESDLAADGRDPVPHVTVKYGLHDDNPAGVQDLLQRLNVGPLTMTMGKTGMFSTPDADVVMIPVASEYLVKLNAEITANLEVTNTYPIYFPHITLAYVTPGTGLKYVGQDAFEGRTFTVDTLVFSSTDDQLTEIPLKSRAMYLSNADLELMRILEEAVHENNTVVIDHILGLRHAGEGNPNHAPAGSPEGGQFISGPGGGETRVYTTTFDPNKIKGMVVDHRLTPQQMTKLHAALQTVDGFFHDSEINTPLWEILSAFTPRSLHDEVLAIQSGQSHLFSHTPKNEVIPLDQQPMIRANAGTTVDAALQQILTLMADPETGAALQEIVLEAIKSKSWDAFAKTLKTAGGPGSGNFGHAGRPGEIGGSTNEHSAADVGAGTGGGNPSIPAWKDPGGFEHTGITWKQPTDPVTGRPIPIKVNTVEEGAALILQGKVVEVPDTQTAFTLIDKLAQDAVDAKAAGKDAKEYDLCNVSVAGSNLFCAETLQKVTVGDKTYEHGIPRIEMPQLGGKPVPGSEADKLPRNPWDPTEVDGSKQFITHLQGIGIQTTSFSIHAEQLKASQREMQGAKVGAMMRDKSFDPAGPTNPLFISNDNYIIDGHHRWAAAIGRDLEDGHLGDARVSVIQINAPVSEALHLANAWSAKFGIQQAPAVTAQAKGTGLHSS